LTILHVENGKAEIWAVLVDARNIDDESAFARKITGTIVFEFSQLAGTGCSDFVCLDQ
jgi:hypothetical protein